MAATDKYGRVCRPWNTAVHATRSGRMRVRMFGLTPEQAIRPQTFWCDQCDRAAEGWVDVGGTLVNGFRCCPMCGRAVRE